VLPYSKSLSTVEQFRILLYFYWCAFKAVKTSAHMKTGYDKSDLRFPFFEVYIAFSCEYKKLNKKPIDEEDADIIIGNNLNALAEKLDNGMLLATKNGGEIS
jgi:hypothetical protein